MTKPPPVHGAREVELTPEESYSAGGLFTVALYARQAAMLNPSTGSVEAELLASEPKPAAEVAPSEEARSASDPRNGVLAAVQGKEAAASTAALAAKVLERLGLTESSAKGIVQLPSLSNGLSVREGLEMFMQPLRVQEGMAGSDVQASLARIIRKLVVATFLWLDDVVAEKQEEGVADAGELTAQQMAATAAAILERWHDSRAAQAVMDLCSWLRDEGAPPVRQAEMWMAADAARSLADHKEVAAKFAAAPSWGMKRVLLVGGTTAVAGTLLAVTGGLAAPAIAAGLTSAASVFGGAGAAAAVSGVATTATVTTAMGATGAGYGGKAMMRRTGEVKEFAFLLMSALEQRALGNPIILRLKVDENGSSPVSAEIALRKGEKESLHGGSSMMTGFKNMMSFPKKSVGSFWKSSGSAKGAPKSESPIDNTAVPGKEAVAMCDKEPHSSGLRRWEEADLLSLPWPNNPEATVLPECTICVAGWVSSKEKGYVEPFSKVMQRQRGWGKPEAYCLVWESKQLVALHDALMNMAKGYAAGKLKSYFLTHYVSAGLMTAIALPASLLAATTTIIDNSWSTAMDRADKAGLVLAQRLVSTAPASRPVRLVGFSMGARLIFTCLLELARCGHRGVVSEVLLVGAPISLSPNKWASARSVVAGAFINGHCRTDWLLGMVYATSQAFVNCAAGLRPVSSACPDAGVLDVDLLAAGLVNGHTDYPKQMGRIMAEVGMAYVPSSSGSSSSSSGSG